MFAWIDIEAPLPIPPVTMTHATPMTIPRIVSAERSLFRAIDRKPTLTMFSMRSTGFVMTRLLWAAGSHAPA
jgi:hypothetical protein